MFINIRVLRLRSSDWKSSLNHLLKSRLYEVLLTFLLSISLGIVARAHPLLWTLNLLLGAVLVAIAVVLLRKVPEVTTEDDGYLNCIVKF